MARFAVVLSGCGRTDGSEIHESTLALLCLAKAGAGYAVFAPDLEFTPVSGLTGKPEGARRNALTEAARIARGDIADLARARAEDFAGLILPGGLGAVTNLCDFKAKGAAARVLADLASLILAMADAKKPIGAICIAPVILALVLGERRPRLTIGNDPGLAATLSGLGARHVDTPVDEICLDEDNLIVSTPAYMLGPGIAEVAAGIEKLTREVVRLAGEGM